MATVHRKQWKPCDENLSKAEVLERYQAVVGVKDVSISVGEGEIFCIMGLSGSGKSTLVRQINRLIEPTGGEILINGVDVDGLNAERVIELVHLEVYGERMPSDWPAPWQRTPTFY